jgi:hypothetical protein
MTLSDNNVNDDNLRCPIFLLFVLKNIRMYFNSKKVLNVSLKDSGAEEINEKYYQLVIR